MTKNQNPNEKKDCFAAVMIVQSLVCAVILIAMFISFRSEGSFFELMKNGYAQYNGTDFTDEDFSQAFRAVKDYIAVFAPVLTQETEPNSESAETELQTEVLTEEIASGGVDLEFSALDTLEGVCFDGIDIEVEMDSPLKDYRLTSQFGYRINPVSGVAGIHTGTDMAAAKGTPIYAVADGTVMSAAWDDGYGYNIKIRHGENTVTVYAHCSRLCVKEGDTIRKGEKIAEVGSTGNSTGNHLHFEIRKDNIKIDPAQVLDF